MGKLGGLVLCGMALCGSVQTADAQGSRAAVIPYARQFDNEYVAASQGKRPTRPPYDAAAASDAQKVHDDAFDQCETRRAEFSNGRARMECYLEADRQFASIAKIDATLLEIFQATVRRAAGDADSGKLAPEQLDNVYFTISQAYAAIIHDQDAAWRKTHPQP